MPKFVAIWCFCLVFVFTAYGEAAYVIRLKNGNEFITGRYWHDGRQVMFDTYGGVIGIERSFVVAIEESNKPLKIISTVENAVETKSQVATKDEKEPKKELSPAGQKGTTQRDEDPILANFDALKRKSNGLEGMFTPELQDFSRNLTELKRKIQLSGKSNDYLREFAEISEMGERVETALKSRR